MTYSRTAEIVTLDFRFDEFRALLAVLRFAQTLARDHAINPEIAGMIGDFSRRIDHAVGGDRGLFAVLPDLEAAAREESPEETP
jgi:hypothetical protein